MQFRMDSHYFLLCILSVLFAHPAMAADRSRNQLNEQLTLLQEEAPALDRKTRTTLQDIGVSSQREYIKRRDALAKELNEWDEDIDLGVPQNFDIEVRRDQLKEDVRIWTNTISAWELQELKAGIADALVIAEADGLNINKLRNIYKLTKHIIRTADFVPPNQTELLKLEALNLSASDRYSTQLYNVFMQLTSLGTMLEEIEARARKEHQEYRKQLYKRAVVAFIRALISGNEAVPLCRKTKIIEEVPTNAGAFKLLGCPDPVADQLKAYAQAVQKIQSADVDIFKADVEILIAEQQFMADIMSAAPFVGEALDIYAILWDQDIAGQCVSTEYKVVSGVFLALPVIGKAAPWAIRQIEKRSPVAAEVIAQTRLIFEVLSDESISALTYVYREMGIDLTERLAKRFDSTPAIINNALEFFKSFRPQLSASAQSKMTTFRTVRDAVESRHWRDRLPLEALDEAIERSGKIVKNNLDNYQMTRQARISASNIVPYHVPALERVAKDRDRIIIVRYVNEASTDLIAAGAGTKHMLIKGKSANRGPIKALLPVNQNLNKQGSRLEDLLIAKSKRSLDPAELDEIVKLQKGIKNGADSMEKCLKDPNCAIAIEYPVKNPLGEGDTILQVARDKSKGRHVYFVTDDSGRRFHPESGKPLSIDIDPNMPVESVKVLADPTTGAPLTADYDFLGVGVKPAHGVPTFDPQTGYVTEQINETIEDVNRAIAETQRARGLEPRKVSHHGAERWYPFSPGALDVDPFVTVFDPDVGIKRIPRCDSDCMKSWCRKTGSCNPAAICPPKEFNNCIPPDHDRLLKDYYHDRRLAQYDLSPNSVWSWGHYNPGGGWSFASYAESYRQKQIKAQLARDKGKILLPPVARKASFGDVRNRVALPAPPKSLLDKVDELAQASTKGNITTHALKQALPKCTGQAE